MDFSAKRILVVGMARSGAAAIRVLAGTGAHLSICDRKTVEELGPLVEEMQKLGAVIHTGTYPSVTPENYDLLIASPGIPLEIPPFQQAFAQGIPVIGEIELACLLKPPHLEICAVTGTNGKTTTTALLEHILAAAGRPTAAAGNIGVPLTSLVEHMEEGIIALEMSSFQLESIREFHPHICGILNITPDHLDRHKNMDGYIEAKARIFLNQGPEDFCVLNLEDPLVRDLAEGCKARVVFFSNQQFLEEGAYLEQGSMKIAWQGQIHPVADLKDINLRGQHNQENLLCAAMMAFLAGVQTAVIGQALSTFQGVRHRMEEVATIRGVLYINDSKATNPDSAMKALQSFDQSIILIAGGRNKGSQFDVLAQVIRAHVKGLILLGEAHEQIRAAVIKTGFTNIHEVEDFDQAVQLAASLADPGDVVLLSPACASWDMFDNYEQRGDLFCRLVRSSIQPA
ncbi:MAG TPA: UDP-N-acetylmuramoyl-L-alanine--D-glutamate ligase [Syntrophomonadaceae bacterium]|nr:UDP-N-acetylmuramoyl-L-alanine--D-glutamate ligase [Syntrophomonadaceae bacterium]